MNTSQSGNGVLERADRAVSSGLPWWLKLAIPVLAIGSIVLVSMRMSTRLPSLDTHKVALFPLVATGDSTLSTLASGAPSIIGARLEAIPALHSVQPQASGESVARPVRGGSHRVQLGQARAAGAGYLITGDVTQLGDSLSVTLRLVDVSIDSVVTRAEVGARGSTEQTSTLVLRAVGMLLPSLREGGARGRPK